MNLSKTSIQTIKCEWCVHFEVWKCFWWCNQWKRIGEDTLIRGSTTAELLDNTRKFFEACRQAGINNWEISSKKLQIWFAIPKNVRTLVGLFGVGNSDKAFVSDGSILYPVESSRNPPNRTSVWSHWTFCKLRVIPDCLQTSKNFLVSDNNLAVVLPLIRMSSSVTLFPSVASPIA
jgi:hypothetical protein